MHKSLTSFNQTSCQSKHIDMRPCHAFKCPGRQTRAVIRGWHGVQLETYSDERLISLNICSHAILRKALYNQISESLATGYLRHHHSEIEKLLYRNFPPSIKLFKSQPTLENIVIVCMLITFE